MEDNIVITEKEVHDFFDFALILKGIHAVIEIGSGLIFYFVSTENISRFIRFFIHDEIVEDPNGFVVRTLAQLAEHLSASSKFSIAFYLVSHGIINSFIVIALWKEKLWAYPVSFAILSIFTFYQLYKYIFFHTHWLIWLIILNVIVLLLIWHEYRIVKKKFTRDSF